MCRTSDLRVLLQKRNEAAQLISARGEKQTHRGEKILRNKRSELLLAMLYLQVNMKSK